jgi:oxygen-independent coproporphyrinogen III oxidase
MSADRFHGLAIDTGAVLAAIGGVPRVAYEAAHVYPLSAPAFVHSPARARERLEGGACRLYVHIPFCRYACTFCFYAKRINTPRAQMQRYVDALRRELDGFAGDAALHQLYVGGGTPTALPADLLDAAVGAVIDRLPLEPGACHTVEASPESVTSEHSEVLKQRGIGRISLGVQTLDEGLLESVNRQHSAREARDACAMLVDSGLCVNVDLIYGMPGQTETSLRHDIETFAALGVDSLTLYNLRLNEHTPLARVVEDLQRLELSGLVRWRRFIELTMDRCGYDQRRWHTFTRRDRRAAGHDRAPGMNAFGSGRELGIGVSAFSHINETIYRNHQGFDAYLERVETGTSPVEDVFPLTSHDRRTLFIARTLGDGRTLDPTEYARSFGTGIADDFGPVLERLQVADLVRADDGHFTLTAIGRLVYDLVTIAFYPDGARQWLDQRQQSRPRRSAQSVQT